MTTIERRVVVGWSMTDARMHRLRVLRASQVMLFDIFRGVAPARLTDQMAAGTAFAAFGAPRSQQSLSPRRPLNFRMDGTR